MSAADRILPGTERGTTRSAVEGAWCKSRPAHFRHPGLDPGSMNTIGGKHRWFAFMGPDFRQDDAGFKPSRRSAEDGFRSSWRFAEHGFTLIEMLVALAIFSLAALALLRLETATVATTARLQDQSLAQLVARNIAVETMTDPVPPAYGDSRGSLVNAGRRWSWVRRTARTPEPRIQQILIQVTRDGGQEAATLTIFRRGPQ
ncbi:MAG TPA: type II secretion system minor pseudopilin GspI [Allosphingosinicella sp.]